jgi:uncharacterized membrane protein (DUF106 family)
MILLPAQPGFTQSSAEMKSLRKEIEELKEGQKAIQKDLEQIKTLLQAQGLLPEEPKNLFVDIAGKPLRGNKEARLVLVEFSEYQ